MIGGEPATPHRADRGFAMLLVFVMAASIGIMLFLQLPRVAFESQRNREQLLIERGEQYSRAIQIYFRKFKKYPASLDDLENTNNIRFLRRRYADPLTGKNEWRLIHIGPGGVFTDSLVNKPKGKEGEKSVNTFTWEAPTVGGSTQQGAGGPAFPPLRPSEQRGATGQLQPGEIPPTGAPADPNAPPLPQPSQLPGRFPPTGLYPPPQPGQAPGVYPPPGQAPTGQPQQFPQPFLPGPPQPGQTQFPQPGQPQFPQPGQVQPFPYSTQPGAQGATPVPFGQPGRSPIPGGQPGAANPALGLIQQILTSPRPGGLPGATQAGAGGFQIGGGIAGVASMVERQGIKIYNERDKYNEWEFLYDFSKDRTAVAGLQGVPGQQGQPGVPGAPGVPLQPGQPLTPGQQQPPVNPFIGAPPAPPGGQRPGAPLGRTR